MWRNFLDGSLRGVVLAAAMIVLAFGGNAAVRAQAIYWADGPLGAIYRANLDGSGAVPLLTGLGVITDLAIDVPGRTLYWTDAAAERIVRANVDGTNVTAVVSAPSSSIDALAVDSFGQRLYWADNAPEHVFTSDLDGGGPHALFRGFDSIDGVSVDQASGRVYWTDNSGLWRGNADGSDVRAIVDFTADPSNGRRVAVDSVAGKVYWTDAFGQRIRRASFDGSQLEDVIGGASGVGSPVFPFGLAIDPAGGKLYWTEWGEQDPPLSPVRIRRANLDGTAVEDLVTAGLRTPDAIAFDPVPEPSTLALALAGAAILVSVGLRRRLKPGK